MLSQKLEQIIQERGQIAKEYQQLKDAVEKTCKGILGMEVREEESTKEKAMKLNLTIKEQKDKVVAIQFRYDVKISELQLKLQ